MTAVIEFELPGLPRMTNNSGRTKTHWAAIAKEKKSWKLATALAVRPYLPREPHQAARLILTRHSAVEPDYDGLVSGFKPIIDALVECGFLAGDKRAHIGVPQYDWCQAAPKHGYVSVYIEVIQPKGKA